MTEADELAQALAYEPQIKPRREMTAVEIALRQGAGESQIRALLEIEWQEKRAAMLAEALKYEPAPVTIGTVWDANTWGKWL
jgi:hypothetical protein